MSNLIKAQYIHIDDSKKMIDSDNSFKLLTEFTDEVMVKQQVADDLVTELVNGVNAEAVEKLLVDESELLIEKASDQLKKATAEAEEIIKKATEEANQLKLEAIEEGKQLGYSTGYEEAMQKVSALEQKLELQAMQQQEEYKALLASVEPMFAEITAKLVEKLTGVMVQQYEGVILHLIHSAISNIERSNSFVIHVSKEDYPVVVSNKERIISEIDRVIEISILEDAELETNQCLIETDQRYIDCSLGVQMEGLLADLRVLSCNS